MAGTPFIGIGTVSQKSFPARRQIFSSRVKDSNVASTFTIMAGDLQDSVEDNLWHEKKRCKFNNDNQWVSRSIYPVERRYPVLMYISGSKMHS